MKKMAEKTISDWKEYNDDIPPLDGRDFKEAAEGNGWSLKETIRKEKILKAYSTIVIIIIIIVIMIIMIIIIIIIINLW